jgi:hypothetical protein
MLLDFPDMNLCCGWFSSRAMIYATKPIEELHADWSRFAIAFNGGLF